MGARVPNPLEIRAARTSRLGRLIVDGSPPFPFTSPAILVNDYWLINLVNNTPHGQTVNKYLPLDHVEVLNESGSEIEVTLNDVVTYTVKASSSRTINRKFWQLKVRNIGTVTVAAGELDLIVELMPEDADKAARRAAARVSS